MENGAFGSRVAHSLAAMGYRASMAWMRVSTVSGGYLDPRRQREASRDFRFMSGKQKEYQARRDDDLAHARDAIQFNWGGILARFFSSRGLRWMLLGVATAFAVAAAGWSINHRFDASLYTAVGVATVAMLGSVALGRSPLHLAPFAWGMSIPVFVGLNTIEFSSLPNVLQKHVDSQAVMLMFVAAWLLMGLREAMDQRKPLELGAFEDGIIRTSVRLTWGARVRRLLGIRGRIQAREGALRWFLGVLYCIFAVRFVGPMLNAIQADVQDGAAGAGIVGVTLVTVALPIAVFLGRRNGIVLLAAIIGLGSLVFGWMQKGSPVNGSESEIGECAVIEVDATVRRRVVVVADGGVGQEELEESVDLEALKAPVFFGFDSWQVRKREFQKVERMQQVLHQHRDLRVRIEGHSDSIGGERYNRVLGKARAESVLELLVEDGLESSRFTTMSHGAERPRVKRGGADNRGENRRVELMVVEQGTNFDSTTGATIGVVLVADTIVMNADTVVVPCDQWSDLMSNKRALGPDPGARGSDHGNPQRGMPIGGRAKVARLRRHSRLTRGGNARCVAPVSQRGRRRRRRSHGSGVARFGREQIWMRPTTWGEHPCTRRLSSAKPQSLMR